MTEIIAPEVHYGTYFGARHGLFIQYYEVTSRSAVMVTLCPVGTHTVERTSPIGGLVVPSSQPTGAPIRRKIHMRYSKPEIDIDRHTTATLWDRRPEFSSDRP